MNSKLCLAVLLSASAVAGRVDAADDILIASFENSTYTGWKTEGNAFGSGPATGDQVGQFAIEGARGNGVASSELAGDEPQGILTSPTFKVARRYLSFVIGGGGYEHHTCVNLLVDGKVVRSATGTFSDSLKPVSWDVRAWAGKNALIQVVDQASGRWGHINVDHILQTDTPERRPVTTQPLYRETYRPQVHFTARQWTVDRLNPGQREEGWLNDLNGLVYYDGEYHLFAQRWNKCWIHAVSKDLIHWTELEPAFWEESLDSGVQSGNCVIDVNNTSGLSPDPKTPPMVAFWSRNDNRSHCISYSLDHGRSWTHYAGNPVLVKPERDPMVFWHKPSGHWVMIMYGEGKYHVLTSNNLINWTDVKKPIGNSFECPDFFELPIDGDKTKTKWVLVRADGKYSLGTFDGEQFTEETTQLVSDVGPTFYATQSWGNTETGDGRRIQAAWMRGGTYPDMPFNQQVSFPCQLTLRTTPDGVRLFREPITEIAKLHRNEKRLENRLLLAGEAVSLKQPGDAFHIKMNVRIPVGSTLTLDVRGVPVTLTHDSIANGTDPVKVRDRLKTVEIIIDRTSIEVFGNNGEVSTSRCYLAGTANLSLQATGGDATVQSLSSWQLESAWKGNEAYEASK
jgi:fructan beta-fructosidase